MQGLQHFYVPIPISIQTSLLSAVTIILMENCAGGNWNERETVLYRENKAQLFKVKVTGNRVTR